MRARNVMSIALVSALACSEPGASPSDGSIESDARTVMLPDGRVVVAPPRDGGGRPDPMPIDSGPVDPNCGLDAPAFCENFETAHPGGRGGEIDETRFAFARWADDFRHMNANSYDLRDGTRIALWSNPDGPPTLCGEEFSNVAAPNDVRVCNGQLNELIGPSGQVPINSFMIRQPFDFRERTGTIVFDVDAKRNDGWDGHGWWLEFWVTEDPAPVPYHEAAGVASYPRNGVGFQIAPHGDAFDNVTVNTVGAKFIVVRDYQVLREDVISHDPPTIRVRDRHLNRFRVEISRDHFEIFGSDFDNAGDELRRLARVDGLDLNFEVGYVHFQHVHYNPAKTPNCVCRDSECGHCPDKEHPEDPEGHYASPTQVYRWDNIGFDGPVLPALRGYDAMPAFEAGEFEVDGHSRGYVITGHVLASGETLEFTDVDPTDALYATLNLVWMTEAGAALQYSVNGNPTREFRFPPYNEGGMTTLSADVPIEDLVPGTNTIEFVGGGEAWVTGVDLTVHPSR
jgi:hypothetical protein